jgi:hypothetical protein
MVRTPDELQAIVDHLLAAGGGSEWSEFKENNQEPDSIGKYIYW